MTRLAEGRLIALALILAGLLAGLAGGWALVERSRDEWVARGWEAGYDEASVAVRQSWLASISNMQAVACQKGGR